MFTFERLSVYQRSLLLMEAVESLSADLKGRASFSLLDQLSRATLSIPLNIAEGEGRWHKSEKRQFLRIARGSAFEIVPILQVLQRRRLIDGMRYGNLYAELEAISKMLITLEKSLQNLRAAQPPLLPKGTPAPATQSR